MKIAQKQILYTRTARVFLRCVSPLPLLRFMFISWHFAVVPITFDDADVFRWKTREDRSSGNSVPRPVSTPKNTSSRLRSRCDNDTPVIAHSNGQHMYIIYMYSAVPWLRYIERNFVARVFWRGPPTAHKRREWGLIQPRLGPFVPTGCWWGDVTRANPRKSLYCRPTFVCRRCV